MDNILDLIVEYSKKSKLIDTEFLRKISKIMIKEKSLEDYIDIVYMEPDLSATYKEGCLGYYDVRTKELVMSEQGIMENYIWAQEKSGAELTKYEEFLLANVLEVQVILHEFEHVNQMRKIDLCNDFEALLLKVSCSFDLYYGEEILKGNDVEKLFYEWFKSKYYGNMPNERLAENYSRIEIYKIMKVLFDDINPQIKMILRKHINGALIRGYDENNLEPTESFLIDYDGLLFSKPNPLLNVEFYEALAAEKEKDFKDRLFLGLGLTSDEFNDIKLKKKKK